MASGSIFLNSTDVRNNARTYLIGLQEVRGIEEAILFAADSGLLTAIVYNTYMTQTCLPAFKTITVPTVATGTVTAPTFTVASQIVIDGITVTLTGTTLAQTVIDINAALTAAQNTTVTASQASSKLVITDSSGGDITTSGAAATVAGLAATTLGVIDTINNKLTIPNHGFQTGDEVILSTSGTFPIPLAGGTIYWVLVLDVNNIQLCSSYLNAVTPVPMCIPCGTNSNPTPTGTPIIISTSGTGTLQIRKYSPQEQYYDAWVGNGNADANRPLIDQMNLVTTHFTNLGYTITQQQNPNVTTAGVFWWVVRW